MATIDFKIKNIRSADGTTATMAELDGSIDASTINQFQTVMDKLVEKGVRNLILDLNSVKYINSTGLGILLKYSDTFEGVEGHLVFCRVPSKVMLVMEMLGFNALFQIFADEAMALKFLGGKMVPPAAVPVKPEQAAQPPVAAPVAPPPAPSPVPIQPAVAPPPAAAPVPAPAPAPVPAPAPAPAQVQPALAPVFPMNVPCARCRVTLEITAAGKYKCPRCGAILVAEPAGRVRFFASKRGCPVEMSIPADPALAAGAGEMAGAVARSLGVNGATATSISEAVREACRNVIERAYGENRNAVFHLLIAPSRDMLTIKISDFGKTLDFGQGGSIYGDAGFASVVKTMDTVEHRTNPKGGNLLTLIKVIKSAPAD